MDKCKRFEQQLLSKIVSPIKKSDLLSDYPDSEKNLAEKALQSLMDQNKIMKSKEGSRIVFSPVKEGMFSRKLIPIKGSTGNIYQVLFSIDDGKLKASCNCPAGKKGILCKHVIGIMLNDEDIHRELDNYGYLSVYNDYLAKLDESEKIKKEASNIKKKFERLLLR